MKPPETAPRPDSDPASRAARPELPELPDLRQLQRIARRLPTVRRSLLRDLREQLPRIPGGWRAKLGFIQSILAERSNALSRYLMCREQLSLEEYQYWLDRNPHFTGDARVEHITLEKQLNDPAGTNAVFRAHRRFDPIDGHRRGRELPLVVKICKPYAPQSPFRQDLLNMIHSAFLDEIRVNALIRTTNIEGVVQSQGGGWAGRLLLLRLELIPGRTLEELMCEGVTPAECAIPALRTVPDRAEQARRLSQLAYLANTLSQLHHYRIFHLDLKPANLMRVEDPQHPLHGKILVMDFGFANARLRDTVNSWGGRMTPLYAAPEQALQVHHLSHAADYFSFGVLVHELLTGQPLYPRLMEIFIRQGHRFTEEYMAELRDGRVNLLYDTWPEVAEAVDRFTTFDSSLRLQMSPNLFDTAYRWKALAQAEGVQDPNTEFLESQLRHYRQQGERFGF